MQHNAEASGSSFPTLLRAILASPRRAASRAPLTPRALCDILQIARRYSSVPRAV